MTAITNRRILFSALLASALAAPAIACSTGDDTNVTNDDGQPDASAPDAPSIPKGGEDASVPDADAGIDAAVPPRTCSEDAVCYTTLPPKSFLRDVWSAGDGVIWAVGWADPLLYNADGLILRWDGTAWTEHSRIPLRLNAIWGSSATDIWVGGDGGLFHGTGPSSAAITWTKVRSEPIVSIWGSSANDVWAVGHTQDKLDGKVLHYRGPSAEGDGWEIDPISSRPAAFRKVWGSSASDVWLGANEFSTCGYPQCNGTRAFALHRAPDGTWSEDGLPDFVGITAVHHGSEFSGGGSITEGSVWMMGSRSPTTYEPPAYGLITDILFVGTRKADGSGYSWTDTTFGSCSGYDCKGVWFNRAVWGKTPNDVYLAGDKGQLRHWNGTSFTYVKTRLDKLPLMTSFYGMWGSSSTDLWIVGDEIALHKVAKSDPTNL
ncbi:hypothetical protein [Labilithrix luteola]|nr:hypothetical protein [Labilithrix luteola]